MTVVDLAAALSTFDEHWQPRMAARVDDYGVRVVKLLGDFVWHQHEDADELFLVLQGQLTLRFRDRDEQVGPGQLIVVPAGVEHCPSAPEEVHVLLFERNDVVNTGDAGGERTFSPLELDAQA